MNKNYDAGRLRVGHNCGIYLKASFILYDFARWHRVVRFYIFQLLIYILLFNHVCKVTPKELANICTIVERVNESSLNLKTTNALLTHFNLRGEESNERWFFVHHPPETHMMPIRVGSAVASEEDGQ